jgi:hypothetical protein
VAHDPSDHARIEVEHVVDAEHFDCAGLAVRVEDLVQSDLAGPTSGTYTQRGDPRTVTQPSRSGRLGEGRKP